jgi:hypothetical protein
MMINHEELDEMMGNRLSVEEGRELTSTGLEIIARIKELPDNPDMFLGAFCGIYANMQQLHKDLVEIALFALFLRAQEYLKGKIDAGEIVIDAFEEEDPENDFREV